MTIPELYAAIDGSYESVKRILPTDALVEKFVLRIIDEKSFERLKNAKDSHDPKELFEAAHAIKGICANVGLDKLSAQASVVAEEFRPQKERTMSDAELDAHLDQFFQKYEATVATLRDYIAAK
ncbi:MAG: Hpt domain-containing protein [Desulfovibrio sp.]|nr:Hpt domain-containing protein [Desulfovibrio sp.]